MTVQLKRNLAGYTDEQGRFRPIRSPKFVGSPSRKAKKADQKKYSRAKAGDLGKRRQQFALEDIFDKEIRKQKEAKEKEEKEQKRLMREIERDIYGSDGDGRNSQTLVQFVRSHGGIRRTYRFGGRKGHSGKRSSWDAGEVNRLSYKQTGRRGLTTDKGGQQMDRMFQAVREAGYPVTDIDDMMSRLEDEAAGGKPTYATHGFLDYRDNPKMRAKQRSTKRSKARAKKPSASKLAKAAVSVFDNDLDLDVDARDIARLRKGEKVIRRKKKNPSPTVRELMSKVQSGFVCLECGHKFRSLASAERAAYEDGCPDCGGTDIDIDVYVSQKKNGILKRNPIGWFKDVSPVTADAVKKLYRQLAAKYHPDKGGDTRTMQEINSDYDKAMKIAAGNEGNEYRAKNEREAAKPLREAIEFAVTLPDDVDVVIRGLWLWLQGNTYSSREKIKAFTTSDGKRFKWASQKKAWFFAAVPSKNRGRELSFDEIDQLHGRELVNERKRRLAINPKRKRKNPIDPLGVFTNAAVGIASALQIKEYMNRPTENGRRKTPARTKAKRKNPVSANVKQHEREFERLLGEIRKGNLAKARSAKLKGRLANYSVREVDNFINLAKLAGRLKLNPRRNPAKKKNASKVPHRRTFSMFQGRPATKANARPVSRHAPAKLDQLGDLIEVKLSNGQVIKPNPKRFKLCAASGRLWIVGGRFAKSNPREKANVLNPMAEISHVVYGTHKPHHGDHAYTHYIHKLGEVSGKRPILAVDREGFPVIRGGNYKIEARGIVD